MPQQTCKHKCMFCQKKTENPKFCNRSCAASYNNTKYPKRSVEQQNICVGCIKFCYPSPSAKTKGYEPMCRKCRQKKSLESFGEKTKAEMVSESTSYASKHRYEKIRQYGKRLSDFYGWRKSCCQKCGYDKHTELCHLKSIESFDDDVKISTINSKDNIVYLCPNCHWELDNLIVNDS
jgi:hypothetical protein